MNVEVETMQQLAPSFRPKQGRQEEHVNGSLIVSFDPADFFSPNGLDLIVALCVIYDRATGKR